MTVIRVEMPPDLRFCLYLNVNNLKKDVSHLNEINETYTKDIQDKKRTAQSASKKAKRGGKVHTPADLLSGKERREYEAPSPVVVSSIYDHLEHIPTIEKFKSLPREEQIRVLTELKARFSVAQISNRWGVTPKTTYYHLNKLGLTCTGKRTPRPVQLAPLTAPAVKPEVAQTHPPQSKCTFVAVGNYNASSLSRKLQGLAHALCEDQRYHVEIHVTELPQL